MRQPTQQVKQIQVQVGFSSLRQFISRDPLSGAEFSQGDNLYAYFENNYTDLDDPTGDSALGVVTGILDTAGTVPVLNEFTNPISAVVSLASGDYVGAGLAIAGEIPIAGEAADVAKDARDIAKAGKKFTRSVKNQAKALNREKNDGRLVSDKSGDELVPGQQHTKGVTPPDNEAHEMRQPTQAKCQRDR